MLFLIICPTCCTHTTHLLCLCKLAIILHPILLTTLSLKVIELAFYKNTHQKECSLQRMLNTIEGEEGGGCLIKGVYTSILSPAYGICLLWSSKHFSFSDLAIFWISKPENLCISIHQLHVMHYIVHLMSSPPLFISVVPTHLQKLFCTLYIYLLGWAVSWYADLEKNECGYSLWFLDLSRVKGS